MLHDSVKLVRDTKSRPIVLDMKHGSVKLVGIHKVDL